MILMSNLDDVNLSDSLVDLIIQAVNEADLAKTHVFESRKAKYSPDDDLSLCDVILATTAAPTYFQSHSIENLGCFVDGGLRANNPSMIAYTKHRSYLNDEENEETKANVFILSIGTGQFFSFENGARNDDSILFWAQNATRYAISGHGLDIDQQMRNLLDEQRYVRLQVDLAGPVKLDDFEKLDDLEFLTQQFIDNWENDGTFDMIVSQLMD